VTRKVLFPHLGQNFIGNPGLIVTNSPSVFPVHTELIAQL